VYCECYAGNLVKLASAADIQYIAENSGPPPGLEEKMSKIYPECGRQADSMGR
jgi:hypothetical protein